MNRIATIALSLTLLALPAVSKSQHFISDSISPERIVVKSTTYGLTNINSLDTYLNGKSFNGAGLHLQHEKLRDARTGNYRWKYQTMFSATIGIASLEYRSQLAGIASYSWNGYHCFNIKKRLKLLAGAHILIEGGALYIASNGNNPASAKLRASLGASAMAIYRIPVGKSDWTARLQADVPLVGVMFAPEFGQSYYEIFSHGQIGRTIAFAHPVNSPSLKSLFTLDIPLRCKRYSTTLRVAYTADIYQSNINHIRCHIYRHAITLGFVSTILKIKHENRLKAYSPY